MTDAAVAGRLPRARAYLASALVPGDGPAVRWFETVSVFVLGAVLGFWRLGSASVHARMWAEDGAVFLQQTVTEGPLGAGSTTYAGYLNSVPRLAAAVVQVFPVRWWGAGVHLAATLVIAAMAAMIYAGLADHVRSRAIRAAAALYVVLVPVGPEVVGSISNLHWFVFTAAFVGLLWTPRTAVGWSAVAVTCVFATTTSPLAGILLVAAVVRALLQPQRASVVLLAVTAVGFAVQTVAMVLAPSRPLFTGDTPGAVALGRGYVTRVVGDGVLGMGRALPLGIDRSVVPGGLVLVAFAALIVLAAVRRWRGPWLLAAVMVALSVALYVLSALSVAPDLTNAVYAGRYWVMPALFLVLAAIVLAGGVAQQWHERPAEAGERVTRSAGRVVAAGVLVALVFAMVSTYQVGDARDRNKGATWAATVRAASQTCRAEPGRDRVPVTILPTRIWTVALPCDRLRPS